MWIKRTKSCKSDFIFTLFFIVFVYNSRARKRTVFTPSGFTASPKHQTPFNSWFASIDGSVKLYCLSQKIYLETLTSLDFWYENFRRRVFAPLLILLLPPSSTPSTPNSGSNWCGRITFSGIFSSSVERLDCDKCQEVSFNSRYASTDQLRSDRFRLIQGMPRRIN